MSQQRVKEERVVISTHNPTMRTALRLVALTAPLWLIYILGLFLGIFGVFLMPVYFDPNERLIWLLSAFSLGTTTSTMLLLNTLVLTKNKVTFPPIKAASLPIEQTRRVSWHWDKDEREAYLRFELQSGEPIDIHYSRLSSKKIADLKDALKKFAPACAIEIEASDLDDLIEFRERFTKPNQLSLLDLRQSTEAIEIPYNPHEGLDKLRASLGANEKYFWYCWMTVMLVPCLLKLPDIAWGMFCWALHTDRYQDVPELVRALDYFCFTAWYIGTTGLASASSLYYQAAAHPLGICMLLGLAIVGLVTLAMNILQPNGVQLRRQGLEVFLHWRKFVLFKSLYQWKDIYEFQLDQCGDGVNPEKWRMQARTYDHHVVNLRLRAIKGTEARETLLRTITEMAPHAHQDPALIRALLPPQKESYTELWLQSLATPPKRNRLAPLADGQKLHAGRYVIQRQLAVGGQAVAYLATDVSPKRDPMLANKNERPTLVLKEFVLPVYTSRTVRKQALERFENEARILRDLDHPQIVKLVDYFLEDHRAYLVLEHIDGMSLRKIVQSSGSLSSALIRDLSLQMCSVLEYLHSLAPPVVHRDFTPDNLILDRNGKLVLIDFNVAQQRQWTTTGTVVGKHAYLPPEQFRGQPSPQSDLYAMGATIFFLLTGKDPEPLSCSHPTTENEFINGQLDTLVANLTEIEVADRYQDIESVRRDLERIPLADLLDSALCSADVPVGVQLCDTGEAGLQLCDTDEAGLQLCTADVPVGMQLCDGEVDMQLCTAGFQPASELESADNELSILLPEPARMQAVPVSEPEKKSSATTRQK